MWKRAASVSSGRSGSVPGIGIELAVVADDRAERDLEVEVGALRLDDGHEGSVDVEHSSVIGIRPRLSLKPCDAAEPVLDEPGF